MALTPEERAYQREYQRRRRAENPEKARETQRRSYVKNREKRLEQQRNAKTYKRWRAENPEKVRGYSLRRNHGMRPEGHTQMQEAQQGRCYLCGDPLPEDRGKVHIDHDHSHCPPGESCHYCRRGLACQPCNALIGLARDNPDRLRRIADNLETALADTGRRLADVATQGELFELGEAS